MDDLQRTLQVAVPFSPIRVRSTSQVITSEEQARAVAEANGAAVIIWGNYTPSLIEVEVQVGSLSGFAHNAFARETLESTANVRVHLQNEREESIAPYVLGVLGLLQTADGNGYETMRTLAVLDAIGGIEAAEAEENAIAPPRTAPSSPCWTTRHRPSSTSTPPWRWPPATRLLHVSAATPTNA